VSLPLRLPPADLWASGVPVRFSQRMRRPASGGWQKVSAGGIPLGVEFFLFNMCMVLNSWLRSQGQKKTHLLQRMKSGEIERSWVDYGS